MKLREIIRKHGPTFAKWYRFVAIQFTTVVLFLLALELLVRICFGKIQLADIRAETLVTAEGVEPVFEYHPFAAFAWIPHAQFSGQTVNSHGFVSTREFPLEKNDDEVRIVTLGGSSTVGIGNLDEHTYPRILETLLQERYPKKVINVVNAAVPGYTTIESLGYLQSRLVHLHPDIVIVMHAWNDMYYYTSTDVEISQWRKRLNLEAMWNFESPTELEDLLPLDMQMLSWSQLYLHLRRWRRSWIRPPDALEIQEKRFNLEKLPDGRYKINYKALNPNAPVEYQTNLQQINQLCELHGIKCFSILQPTMIAKGVDLSSTEMQSAAQKSELYHAFPFAAHIDAFNGMYEMNQNVFDSKQIIDATSMNGNKELFRDHIHQNAKGTNALAKIVLDKLVNEETAALFE